ncbi:unnamed protein product [Prorocentrum cordatum]|uniref:Uncharacterized protein n=1 Tax=Prorocentrum cordatum TaxID=2364126 RepID=A0ABN9PAM5_9DINO|nr:unnamed protein product [Polarella glacialis]
MAPRAGLGGGLCAAAARLGAPTAGASAGSRGEERSTPNDLFLAREARETSGNTPRLAASARRPRSPGPLGAAARGGAPGRGGAAGAPAGAGRAAPEARRGPGGRERKPARQRPLP